MATRLRVAACHAAPIFLSARQTTDKAISLIHQAAANNAQLVVFPETFISAFPIWSAVRPPMENHSLSKQMARESVYANGEEVKAICEAARKTHTVVSMGFSEKVKSTNACLYNANVIIGADGQPRGWLRSEGLPHTFGNIGNLICGENTNPLARYALIAQDEQLHISSWPAIWPTRAPGAVSSSSSDNPLDSQPGGTATSNYDNAAANKIRAAAHCFEAKCFGVVCAGHLDEHAIQTVAKGSSNPEAIFETLRSTSRAATLFLHPTGTQLPSFTIDPETGAQTPMDFLQHEEGILYADMNLEECKEGKQYHDFAGGYQRLDIFKLDVNRRSSQRTEV